MSPGLFRAAADVIVVLHVGFVVFVMLGGLLALRWRRMMWLHAPATIWGVTIEFTGWVCPLTPLENLLRERAGEAMYRGDFIEHYIVPMLYPARLTHGTQILLGSLALAVNIIVYWHAFRRSRR